MKILHRDDGPETDDFYIKTACYLIGECDGVFYGIRPQLFTWGLMCYMDRGGYKYRYCYETLTDAVGALMQWNPNTEPHPAGGWVKLKGDYHGQTADHRRDHIHPDGTLCLWNDWDTCVLCGATEVGGVGGVHIDSVGTAVHSAAGSEAAAKKEK